MREILFRGKRTDNGKWGVGMLARYNPKFDTANIVDKFEMLVPVITKTVGQYTGLTDKNGTKIFEGDIINSNWGKFIIIYNTYFGGFVADETRSGWGWEFLDEISEIEVIGNAHDNPELLKGGADSE